MWHCEHIIRLLMLINIFIEILTILRILDSNKRDSRSALVYTTSSTWSRRLIPMEKRLSYAQSLMGREELTHVFCHPPLLPPYFSRIISRINFFSRHFTVNVAARKGSGGSSFHTTTNQRILWILTCGVLAVNRNFFHSWPV